MILPKGSEWTMKKPTEEDHWKRYWLYFSNPPGPDHTEKILFAEIVPRDCLCFREKYKIKHEYVFVINLGCETETAVSFDNEQLICWQEISFDDEQLICWQEISFDDEQLICRQEIKKPTEPNIYNRRRKMKYIESEITIKEKEMTLSDLKIGDTFQWFTTSYTDNDINSGNVLKMKLSISDFVYITGRDSGHICYNTARLNNKVKNVNKHSAIGPKN